MIRFTILTCTYNAEKELPRTLESVRMQSYPHVQHVIIDGQSKDGTMSLVERYKEHNEARNSHHTVEAVSEKDGGLYDAMNKALRYAKGDYLVFLNAGDALASEVTLEQMAKQLAGMKELPAVLYGNTDIVDKDDNFLYRRRLQPPEKLTWKSFRHGMLVCHQAFYARTDIAQNIPYDLKYKFSADVDWCIRIMKAGQDRGLELFNTHMVLCRYLEGGMSIQNHRASLIERFCVMAIHYGLLTTVAMHLWFFIRKP